MRKWMLALAVTGALGTAAGTAQANEVAVLDWQQALLDTTSAQQSMNQLKNQLGSQPQQVKALGEEVQKLQQRLQSNGDVMSDSERQNVMQQLRQKGGQFQQQRGQLEQKRAQQEQAFLKQARPKLDRAIEQVVKRHNVDVLVDRNSVIYAGDALDLTQEVTKTFNSLN
ncbi:OmpH family outer membrane protein [Kushneria marisflavi]|uniref:Molecular chaperone Skp n=1 Tax=Kushneria marisflavi TaxID=157779 RepID=A0A240URX4_9GAMM|nr:OmpH family outer membrane protein [Kushneria marisflavi]ART63770.1 molecular chaperone Skp [Kushneria marisflavi]RKD85461.1 periplasmic chaperone for outer membrane proteins Skp [Kushneria marisflavi]